ncbi:MAG: hypothetical protein MUC87_07680 [Bacteroidia bacterium]|jgi:hypothetical protein|nr:hypothetical protein [Bacteroidia bacterium]
MFILKNRRTLINRITAVCAVLFLAEMLFSGTEIISGSTLFTLFTAIHLVCIFVLQVLWFRKYRDNVIVPVSVFFVMILTYLFNAYDFTDISFMQFLQMLLWLIACFTGGFVWLFVVDFIGGNMLMKKSSNDNYPHSS